MATTPKGFPYPVPSDPIGDGADAIKALANAADAKAVIVAAGVATIPVANSSGGSVAVVFPTGRFTTTPAVVASCENSTYFIAAYSRTATGCRLYAKHFENTAATASIPVSWIALAIG